MGQKDSFFVNTNPPPETNIFFIPWEGLKVRFLFGFSWYRLHTLEAIQTTVPTETYSPELGLTS